MSDRVTRSKFIKSGTTPSVGGGLGWTGHPVPPLRLGGARYEHARTAKTLLLSRRDQLTLAANAHASLLADKLRVSVMGIYDTSFGTGGEAYRVLPTVRRMGDHGWSGAAHGPMDAPRAWKRPLGGGPGGYGAKTTRPRLPSHGSSSPRLQKRRARDQHQRRQQDRPR